MSGLIAGALRGGRSVKSIQGTAKAGAEGQARFLSSGGGQQKRRLELEQQRDLILSVLEAHPSARDSRFYLKNFDPASRPNSPRTIDEDDLPAFPLSDLETPTTAFSTSIPPISLSGDASPSTSTDAASTPRSDAKGKGIVAHELLAVPASRHTALVKVQGPFSDRQLESIAEGMVYLKKLGLVSIVVMDNEQWDVELQRLESLDAPRRREEVTKLREEIKRETLRFSDALERQGGSSRPLLEGVLCVKGAAFEDTFAPIPSTSSADPTPSSAAYEAPLPTDLFVDSLSSIRSAVRRGEIPIIPPVALDASCFSLCVSANDAVRAIASGLTDAERATGLRYEAELRLRNDVDLTPVRLMIINREGGIPSPARNGDPHLSINLSSEYDYIRNTFIWHDSHPTAMSNLSLIRDCLARLPRTASAVLVSHRSPKSLIANLITNKPALSPSLSHDLLPRRNMAHQPTIVRRGLPIRVHRRLADLDLPKLTHVLEASFGKTLDQAPFFARLERDLDFCIVAGDYEGVAIVTNEIARAAEAPFEPLEGAKAIAYLDKFAVLPQLQGDGTVDFLWGALRDESWGLGLLDALNPNPGGLQGKGEARDLVWRSRSNNPVNRWYWERSTGFCKIPPPKGAAVGFALFWCEAEDRISAFWRDTLSTTSAPGSKNDDPRQEHGRAAPQKVVEWAPVIGAIPSCWV
ncbi:hypothetical protein JCM8097_009412 [Rhodosporidiobolus ruineniae]